MDFRNIDKKWQKEWQNSKIYSVTENSTRPKYYVLDMFPYPSGAGLHVGHPLGYIASDIISRYKRLKGFNVLHPIGYDAFGLPAEQYAMQTGTHPAITTKVNTLRYSEQLKKIGLSYDWDREFKTCDPEYYKWTQWAFVEMFNHFYDTKLKKARPIADLIKEFEKNGVSNSFAYSTKPVKELSAKEWNEMSKREKSEVLESFRLAFKSVANVNWCEEMGTVLANDEVKDGLSVRGGFPVVQKAMEQWMLRITAYTNRLLKGLDNLEWSSAIKEIQRNWIGESFGAEARFEIDFENSIKNGAFPPTTIESVKDLFKELIVYTTRPETIYGVTFVSISSSHPILNFLNYDRANGENIKNIVAKIEKNRGANNEKDPVGVDTGIKVIHPLTKKSVPLFVCDYVLGDYGTGVVMAVPMHDARDFKFAQKYNIPLKSIMKGVDTETQKEAYIGSEKDTITDSEDINGLNLIDAKERVIELLEERGVGKKETKYRLRDAIFSRQRYWGEPIPMYKTEEGETKHIPLDKLPLELPSIDEYKPTKDGLPPLARADKWEYEGVSLEFSTMPGFAGSSAYFLRYMDPKNSTELVSKKANEYWENVDLYVGGIEHATGHLIYSRFWNMFLFDIGKVCKEEPFKRLLNQGMIQGRSSFVYRIVGENKFVSAGLKDKYECQEIHVDVSLVDGDVLDVERFKEWRDENNNATFELENGKYICGWGVEKMSKSLFNVVNPDDIIEKYGADTLRLYEMFLGPIENAKPWDTAGIEGVYKFLRKLWGLCFDENGTVILTSEKATKEELKVVAKCVLKVEKDIENFSFNTSVSSFMICVNELVKLETKKKEVIEPLVVALSPFAPHICEEIFKAIGHKESVVEAIFPTIDSSLLEESEFSYPISINGKTRFFRSLPLSLEVKEIETEILNSEEIKKYTEGKVIKKVIVVKGKIVNVVL